MKAWKLLPLPKCHCKQQLPWVLGIKVVQSSGFALDLEASASLRWNAQLLLFALQRAQRARCGGGE